MTRLSAGVAAVFLALLAFQPAGARYFVQRAVIVTIADSGRAVAISPGQQLRVVLPVQSGTGYAWQVAPGSTPLLSWNHTRSIVGPVRPGAPRAQMLKFAAIGFGAGQLRLEYRRPWEGAQRPANVFVLTVRVVPAVFGGVH